MWVETIGRMQLKRLLDKRGLNQQPQQQPTGKHPRVGLVERRKIYQRGFLAVLGLFYMTSGNGYNAKAASPNDNANQETVTLYPDRPQQTINSFGASDAWSTQIVGLRKENREKIAKLLFDQEEGLGLSGWRFNLGGGVARINETAWIQNSWRQVETYLKNRKLAGPDSPLAYDFIAKNQGADWFLRQASKYGVSTLTAFVNSPPRPMTKNGLTNLDVQNPTSNLRQEYESTFSRYLFDIASYYSSQGIQFDAISPINEPQWRWKNASDQEGSSYSNQDILRLLDRLTKERKKRVARSKHRVPHIDLIESGELAGLTEIRQDISRERDAEYGNYLKLFFEDESIAKKLNYRISSHSYWSELAIGPGEKLISHRLRLAPVLEKLRARYPRFEFWMTEFCILEGAYAEGGHGYDPGMGFPMQALRVWHYDMSLLKASAWYFWTAISKENWKDGLIYVDEKNPNTLILPKMYYAFGQISRYIRPGYQRIDSRGGNKPFGIMTSAYLSPKEDKLVIVAINHPARDRDNTLHPVRGSLNLDIPALRKTNEIPFQAIVTSADYSLKPLFTGKLQNGRVRLPLEPMSVSTILVDLNKGT